jgi:hypothetical protein
MSPIGFAMMIWAFVALMDAQLFGLPGNNHAAGGNQFSFVCVLVLLGAAPCHLNVSSIIMLLDCVPTLPLTQTCRFPPSCSIEYRWFQYNAAGFEFAGLRRRGEF